MFITQPLPPQLSGRAFTVSEAKAAGVGPGRLRGRDLVPAFHAVRAPAGAHTTLEERCRAYRARMHPDEYFSHQTAAELLGLPVPRRLTGNLLHVSTHAPRRAPRSAGVVGHKITDSVVGRHRGLPMVAPVEAWCQLASDLTLRELVVMGDALMRRHAPWSTPEHLRRTVARHAGRRGYSKLREALDHVRARTDSPPETELRLDIVAAGMPEPEVNGIIRNQAGVQIAIGDLVYHEYKVLIEYDGGQHREDEAQYTRDVDRLDDVMHEGWRVIRVNKSHRGERRRRVLEKIRTTLLERGRTPEAPAQPRR